MRLITQRLLWILFVMAFVLPAVCMGQDGVVSIEAEVSRRRAYVGDVLTYQIMVRGADTNTIPTIEFPPSINAVYNNGGRQTFTSVRNINGRQRTVTNDRYTYQYAITMVQPGTITIPGGTLVVNGKTVRSNPITIESIYPARAEEDELQVDVPRGTVYINESVPVDITWLIADVNTSEFTFDSSVFPRSFTVTPVDPVTHGTQQYSIMIAGQHGIGIVDQTTRNGLPQARMRFRVMVTASEPGVHTLGPIRVIFDRSESNARRYRAYAESDPIELTVIPVPEQGKPEGYKGTIGSYAMDAHASNSTVNIGDPIELVLRVRGNEPMQGINTGPDLRADDAFADHFKIASDGWREDLPRQSGTRVYRTTIRALDDTITEIPPVQLPSFDPETGDYRVFRSDPIPLDVRAVREITIADAIGSFDTPLEQIPDESSRIEGSGTGIWAHAPVESLTRRDGFDARRGLRSVGWIGAMGSGPALAMGALLIARRRRSLTSNDRTVRRAWGDAKRLASLGQTTEALRVYLGAVVGCDADAFSSQDLQGLQFDEPVHNEVSAALRLDERAAFGVDEDQRTAYGDPALLERVRNALLRSARTGRTA